MYKYYILFLKSCVFEKGLCMLIKYNKCNEISVMDVKVALYLLEKEAAKHAELAKLKIILGAVVSLLSRYETISNETLLNLDMLGDNMNLELRNNLEYLHKIVANQNIKIK